MSELDELTAELADGLGDGDRLRDRGALQDAEQAYRRVIAAAPRLPEGHYKLGTVLGRLGRSDEAEASYLAALELRRHYPGALNNLGLLCFAQARFDEAEALYRELLAQDSDYLEAHINLGNLLAETKRSLEALYYFRRAVELRPDSALAHERLGSQLRNHGRVVEALQLIGRALELDPGLAMAWNNLGACHFVRGEHAAADAAFARSLELDPQQDAAWNNRLFLSNLMSLDRAEAFRRHQAFGEWIRARCGAADASHPGCIPDPQRRLRVGFVSGDLRHHSVAYFLRSFLPYLERTRFEARAYFNSRIADDMTRELRPLFLHWRNIIDIDDAAAAEAIRRDRIDILIDLGGHTNGNRLGIFARRPAPVQLSWIGYPATTGLDCIDFRLTDAVADPDPEDDRFHTEKLWRLPGPFLCFSPPAAAPDVAAVPSADGEPLTFGSFNARVKLGAECIDLWVSVLEAVPGSRLLVKSINGVEEAEARELLAGEFIRRGVAPERIEILPSFTATADHLAQFGRVDIALDSFPYHGTTTTCEALWMGVPVVTLAGDRHASRVGVSLLTHLDLAELVARSRQEFVEIARALAADPARLAAYRSCLRGRLAGSSLLDGASMARRFEVALADMWQGHCDRVGTRPGPEAQTTEAPLLLKLHIGGKQPREGWKILNVQVRPGVDYLGDIRELESFDEACCEAVYCSHVLEHLSLKDLSPVLGEMHRILAPGGKLYLSVPDFDVLTDLYKRPDLDQTQRIHVLRMIFGGQTDAYDYHCFGMSLELLSGLLALAGFSAIEQVESFGMFDDASEIRFAGELISLNLVVEK